MISEYEMYLLRKYLKLIGRCYFTFFTGTVKQCLGNPSFEERKVVIFFRQLECGSIFERNYLAIDKRKASEAVLNVYGLILHKGIQLNNIKEGL
jgi:hypothetical protein